MVERQRGLRAIEFNAGDDRQGLIWVEEAECHGCGKTKPCLLIDFSGRKYGPGALCRECIDLLWRGTGREWKYDRLPGPAVEAEEAWDGDLMPNW